MKAVRELKSRWARLSRRVQWTLLIIVAMLAVLRLFLPFIVKDYVNRQLNRSKDYSGQIGHVDVQLWRGQYRIHQIEIYKRTGNIKTPFFTAARFDLSIQWKELFHRSLVGVISLHQPKLNFVSGPTQEQTQTGKEEGWSQMLSSLFPFDLNKLDIQNGEVHFQNHFSTPPVDIFLRDISATATNLTNSREIKTNLPAGVFARATALGGGLDFQLQLNPMAQAPTYQLTAQLTNANLVELNDFLKAYGKFDVERGTLALYASMASKEGSYEGYVKVFFENLDVFAWEKERQKNALEIFWQAIVGTVATIFKNHVKDSLAAKIPISGSYEGSKVGTWTAVATVLRHAFIRALVPKLDEPVTVKTVEKKIEKTDEPSKSETNGLNSSRGAEKLVAPKSSTAANINIQANH